MQPRAALVMPFVAVLTAAVAGCGSPATTSAATAPTPAGTTTVTVTVTNRPAVPATSTRTATARPATSTATRTSTPAPTASEPSFAAFAGEWVGHTRLVTVSETGRLEEHVGDGCCDPVIDLVLQLSNPHRSGSSWVATSRVVSAKVHDGWKGTGQPAPEPADRGTVTIDADHILVESISSNGFCDPDRTAPGTCGA